MAVIATHFYFLNFLKNFKLFKSVCKSNTVYNLTISSKKSHTSISGGWIAFLFSWNFIKNMIQLNQLKVIKKEYFWSRNFLVLSISGVSIEVIKKYIQGQGGENEDN